MATTAASLAAMGSILAALSCCLPVFPFLVAAGLAGTSSFLSEVRPYLLAASILFIILGVLSGAARAEMQSASERCGADSVMGIDSFRVDLGIFSSDHGERDRGAWHAVKT